MPYCWKGTFEIWENETFAEIFARHTGMSRILHPDMKDMAVFISRRPLIGNTTLYVYNLREEEKTPVIMALAKKMQVARIWTYAIDEIYGWHSFRECTFTLTLDLTRSEEELWLAIGAKTRNMVRRGMKDGIDIKIAESENELSDWWKIYTNLSADRKFRPQPWNLVHALFKERGLSRLFIAIGNERVIGGCFFLVNRYPMYWLGAFDRAYKEYRSGNLNMWQAILFFRRDGYEVLDLGGLRMDGSYGPDAFKRSFNGETRKAFTYRVPICHTKSLLIRLASSLEEFWRS